MEPDDARTMMVVGLGAVAVAVLACTRPALPAAHADPIEAFRAA